eukprot:XP_014788367.1 PREDICTED: uncharacterized protein LOC106882268 isoform X1 [Octopus bimaculoides]
MSTILTANIPYLLFTFPLQMRAVLIIMLILPVIPTDAEVYPSCKGCMVVGECVCGRAFWVTITKHDCMKKECQWSSVFWKEVGIYIGKITLQHYKITRSGNSDECYLTSVYEREKVSKRN